MGMKNQYFIASQRKIVTLHHWATLSAKPRVSLLY